jgi:integrase
MLSVAEPGMRLFLLLTSTLALRFSECLNLKPADWNRENHTISFRKKGGDQLQLPLTNEIENLLAIAPDHGDAGESFLSRLIPKRHGDLAIRVRQEWTKLRKKAGVDRSLHPHDLRRTAAVTLYELTHDIRVVQQVLGHTNLSTTAWYLQHADAEKIRPIVEAMWRPTGKQVQ